MIDNASRRPPPRVASNLQMGRQQRNKAPSPPPPPPTTAIFSLPVPDVCRSAGGRGYRIHYIYDTEMAAAAMLMLPP